MSEKINEIVQRIEEHNDTIKPLFEENNTLSQQFDQYLSSLQKLSEDVLSTKNLKRILESDQSLFINLYESAEAGINADNASELSLLIMKAIENLTQILDEHNLEKEQIQEKTKKGLGEIKITPEVAKQDNEILKEYEPEIKRIQKLALDVIDLANEKLKTGNDTFSGSDDTFNGGFFSKGNGSRRSFAMEKVKDGIGDNIGIDTQVSDMDREIDIFEVMEGSKNSIISLVEHLTKNVNIPGTEIIINGETIDIEQTFENYEEKIIQIESTLNDIKKGLENFSYHWATNMFIHGDGLPIPGLKEFVISQTGFDIEQTLVGSWDTKDILFTIAMFHILTPFYGHKIPLAGDILKPINAFKYRRTKRLKKSVASLTEDKKRTLEGRKTTLLSNINESIRLIGSPEYQGKLDSTKNVQGLDNLKKDIEGGKKDPLKNIGEWEQKFEKLTTEQTRRFRTNVNNGMRNAVISAEAEIQGKRINIEIAGSTIIVPEKYQTVMREIKVAWENVQKYQAETPTSPSDTERVKRLRLQAQNNLITLSYQIGHTLENVKKASVTNMLQTFEKNLNSGRLPEAPTPKGKTFTPGTTNRSRKLRNVPKL